MSITPAHERPGSKVVYTIMAYDILTSPILRQAMSGYLQLVISVRSGSIRAVLCMRNFADQQRTADSLCEAAWQAVQILKA
jgi:hypothetical protein